MKFEIELSEDELQAVVAILENQPASSIKEVREIDKLLTKLEDVKGKKLIIEATDLSIIKRKFETFSNYNPQKKYRKILISLSDKLDSVKELKEDE